MVSLNKLCCAILLTTCFAALAAPVPFTFNKDSVYAFKYSYPAKSDTIIMSNTTPDTLRIDSILVLFDTTQMPTCEIDFVTGSNGVFQYSYRHSYQYKHLTLNPNEAIKLFNFQFDLCIACPTAKRLATSEVRIGDTIRAALVFYAGNFKDTLKVKSIRNVFSMAVEPRSSSAYSALQPAAVSAGPSFSALGKRVSLKRSSICIITKNSKKIQIRF
jgi:hypothetical protein